jgi:hypothetical protein
MAPKTVAEFRFDLDLAQKPREATLFLLARGRFVAKVNGHEVGTKSDWNEFEGEDLLQQLVAGKSLIEVSVTALEPDNPGPQPAAKTVTATLAGLLKVTDSDRKITRIPLNEVTAVPRPRAGIGLRSLPGRIDDFRTRRELDIQPGPTVFVESIPCHENEWPATPRRSRSTCPFSSSRMVRLRLCQMAQPD